MMTNIGGKSESFVSEMYLMQNVSGIINLIYDDNAELYLMKIKAVCHIK